MHKAFIDPCRCLRCNKFYAARICSVKAIFRIDAEDPVVVEPNLCHGCGDCIGECLGEAIVLKEI